jgi:hypothetical protein
MHHMAVRQNETVRRENESRTGPATPPVVLDLHFDDRRTDTLRGSNNRFGISIE